MKCAARLFCFNAHYESLIASALLPGLRLGRLRAWFGSYTLLRIRPQFMPTPPQLFISVGLPLLLLALTLGTNLALFLHLSGGVDQLANRIDARFERMDVRFERMDSRFDVLTSKLVEMDNRVIRIEDKLGILPR